MIDSARFLSVSDFTQAIDHAPDAIGIIDAKVGGSMLDRRFVYVNKAFERLYDCTRDEVIGKTDLEFFRTRATSQEFARNNAAFSRGDPFRYTRLLRRAYGNHWLEVMFQPVPLGDAEVRRWVFISRDITATRATEAREAQLISAVERASDAIVIYAVDRTDWRFEYVNQAFLKLTGFGRDEIIGRPAEQLLADTQSDESRERYRAAVLRGQTVRREVEIRCSDGQTVVVEFNTKPLVDESSGIVMSAVSILRDITEQKQVTAMLAHDAEHDALTGMYNRRHFEKALSDCIATRRPDDEHAVLFIDLDGFKVINDTLGHDGGDRALCAAATAFESCILGSDVFARWGGDEFVALLYHCNRQNAEHIGRRMIEALAHTDYGSIIGAGVGVSALNGFDMTEVIRRADQACYAAKKVGRNNIYIARTR